MPLTRPTRRGAAAIETGLLVPVMLTLVLPALDYAWYFTESQAVIHAAQNGVRAGAKVEDGDPLAVAAAEARSTLVTELGGAASAATVSATFVLGDAIRVDVSLPFEPPAGFVAMPTTSWSASQMRLEHPR